MNSLKLHGLNGSDLFGFLATYGLFRLLHLASTQRPGLRARLYFDKEDCCAVLDGIPSVDFIDGVVRDELRRLAEN